MSKLNRRALLKTVTVSTAITGLAGCTQSLQRRFTAVPIGLSADLALRLGYLTTDHRRIPVQRDAPIAGEVTIVNHLVWYLAGDSDQSLPLGVFSSPDASILGQSLNPLASLSLRELLIQVARQAILQQLLAKLGLIDSEFTGWQRDPTLLRELTAASFGDAEATVKLFIAQAQATMVLLALTRVTLDDNVVFVAGGRSKNLDELDEGVEPTEAFSEAEVNATVEEFTGVLPELDEINPEQQTRAFNDRFTETPTQTPTETPRVEQSNSQSDLLANHIATDLGASRTVVVAPDGAEPVNQLVERFTQAYEKFNGTAEVVTFQAGKEEFPETIERVTAARPDAVLITGRTWGAGALLEQLLPRLAAIDRSPTVVFSNDLMVPDFTSRLAPLAGSELESLHPITGFAYTGDGEAVLSGIVMQGPLMGLVSPLNILPDLSIDRLKRKLRSGEIDLDELRPQLKKLRRQLGEIKGRSEKLKALYNLVNTLLGETLDPSEQARKLAQILAHAKPLIPSVPGLDQFLTFYQKALDAIANALDVITENLRKADKIAGEVTKPGAWPGGIHLYCFIKAGEFNEHVCQWVVNHEQMLQAFIGGDPVKYKTETLLGIDWLWRDSVDCNHVQHWLSQHRKEVKKLLYGDLTLLKQCDS